MSVILPTQVILVERAVAPVPPPPINEIVGAVVYPEPPDVTFMVVTTPPVITAVAAAPVPPPPVNTKVGALV